MDDIHSRFRQFLYLDRKRGEGGLSPVELRRWIKLKRILNQQLSPGASCEQVDRRDSVRVPARLAVTFQDVQELRGCLMTNLSRGGLFVETDYPAEIGTRVLLGLQIEASGEKVDVPAEVVSINARPDSAAWQHGMGLRFLEMKPEVAEKVDAFYERKLREAAGAKS
jgi:uncharacterized protein (TIGR02266 family)